MEELLFSLLSIILIDLLLGGDNAIVIAMASRNLDPINRKKAILWGTAGAVGLRVIFTFIAVVLLEIPFIQLVGGALLLWIAVKLLKGEESHGDIKSGNSLGQAIKTIIVADSAMSLDNVLAVAGVAHGSFGLILFGLIVSIPIIIWGSSILSKLMNKFPIIITLGGALLGFTAGEMMAKDPTIAHFVHSFHSFIPWATAVGVVVIGRILSKKKTKVVEEVA